MRVEIKQLKANPYRNIAAYPIKRTKVDALKASILQTSFWENVVMRKQDGQFQIAYGQSKASSLPRPIWKDSM